MLLLFGLDVDRNQRIKEFSKGMRQKVVIASALLHRPDVLILDEPFDGLDANTALVMKELLRQLAAQGKTILFSSHILEVVERICTRIVIINRGRQIATGTPAEICAATGTASLDQAFNTLYGNAGHRQGHSRHSCSALRARTRLLAAAGVDAVQWKALTRVFIRTDFGPSLGAHGRGQAVRTNFGLGMMALFYGLTGLGIGLVAAATTDRFLGGTLVVSYVAFLVSSTMLATHAGTIISPEDHAILGYRPVTSRTYFAVRVTTILAHTSLTAALIGFMPVAVFVASAGPVVGLGLLAAIAATSATVTLAIVSEGTRGCSASRGPPDSADSSGNAQLASSSVVYLGIATMSGSGMRHVLVGVGMPSTAWVLSYPGTWFGSYVALASGRHEPTLVVAAMASALCMCAILWSLGGKLTLSYSERLAALATSAAAPAREPTARRWRLPLFERDEPRAIALLIRTQFNNDNRFRLAVLTFVPLTALSAIWAAREGQVADPFLGSGGSGSRARRSCCSSCWYFLPMSLKRHHHGRATPYRASWIFHAALADCTKLVVAARNAIFGSFVVVPYLVLLAAFYAWALSQWSRTHASQCTYVCLGLISQIVLRADRADRSAPAVFRADESCAAIRRGGRGHGGVADRGHAVLQPVTAFVYPHPQLVAAMIVVFAVTVWALDRLTRLRIATTVGDQTYLE